MDSVKIGKYISMLRKEKNLTQEELAEIIGVSSKTISRWEVGDNIPDTNFLYELSKEFGVPTQDILNGGEISNCNVNNETIKNGFNFYLWSFKKKLFLTCFIIILSIVAILSILYTINNYNQNRLLDIKGKNNLIEVNGFIIYNPKEILIMINNVKYENKYVGTQMETRVKKYYIRLSDENGKTIFIEERDLESDVPASLMFSSISISISNINEENEFKYIKNLKKLKFNLIYEDIYGAEFNENIILNLSNHFSNNKILY